MSAYISEKYSEEKKQAVRRVNEILSEIDGLYNEAANLAEEHEFYFSYDGPAGYGDGGSFDNDSGWLASSQSC